MTKKLKAEFNELQFRVLELKKLTKELDSFFDNF